MERIHQNVLLIYFSVYVIGCWFSKGYRCRSALFHGTWFSILCESVDFVLISPLRASHLHLSQHRRDSVEQKHGDGRRNVKNVERRDQESSELRPLLHLCTPGCCSDGEYHTWLSLPKENLNILRNTFCQIHPYCLFRLFSAKWKTLRVSGGGETVWPTITVQKSTKGRRTRQPAAPTDKRSSSPNICLQYHLLKHNNLSESQDKHALLN